MSKGKSNYARGKGRGSKSKSGGEKNEYSEEFLEFMNDIGLYDGKGASGVRDSYGSGSGMMAPMYGGQGMVGPIPDPYRKGPATMSPGQPMMTPSSPGYSMPGMNQGAAYGPQSSLNMTYSAPDGMTYTMGVSGPAQNRGDGIMKAMAGLYAVLMAAEKGYDKGGGKNASYSKK